MDLFSFHFGTVHYQFQGYQDENLKLLSQQYQLQLDPLIQSYGP